MASMFDVRPSSADYINQFIIMASIVFSGILIIHSHVCTPSVLISRKILGVVLEVPAKQHCQFSPFGPIFDGLDWQCYLAGSSKMAPRILIFSIVIGADYSYEAKNSEI